MALLCRVDADAADHVGVYHTQNPRRGFVWRNVHPVGYMSLNSFPGEFDVEGHLGPEEIVWVEPAEDQIGVGDRRQGSAACVACWSGVGASGVRPHVEGAARVQPGDASAACTDPFYIDHRYLYREPFELPL